MYATNLTSLNNTIDGRIVQIESSSVNCVTALVEVQLAQQQRDYFKEQLRAGNVIASINSLKARIGLEQEVLTLAGQQPFTLEQGSVYYHAKFTAFPDNLRSAVASLFALNMPVGKLYAKNPELRLNALEAAALLQNPGFHFSYNGVLPRVRRSTVLLPLSKMTGKHPNPAKLTRELLKTIMWKGISRPELERIMISEPVEDVRLEPNSTFIGSITLNTAGHEMVITDPYHGNSRVAERDTDGDFYVELKAGVNGLKPEFLAVQFYRPELTP